MLRFGSCLALPLLLAACGSGPPDETSSKVLNATAYIRVADRVFTAPVAEIGTVTRKGDCNCVVYAPGDEDRGRKYAEALETDAGHKASPVEAGYVEINPGRSYERSRVNSECGRASSSWKCRAKHLGADGNLPQRFMIADAHFLKQFEAHRTVGGERLFDHLAALAPIARTPKVACDNASKFCTAALELSPQVVAIWDVWPTDQPPETVAAMAERQGQAISIVANGS